MSTSNNPYRDSRRNFIKHSGMVSVGFLGLHHFAFSSPTQHAANEAYDRYGPLLTDPKGILNLPKGFSYKIISRRGEKMDDGFLSPGRNDAMATFRGNGDEVIIIRNHEITSDDVNNGPFRPQNELLEKINRERIYAYGYGTTPYNGRRHKWV